MVKTVKCVCICLDDQGNYSVGLEPQGGQESEDGEMANMSPAKDLDDALNQARDLLTGEETGGSTPDQETDEGATIPPAGALQFA